MTAVFERHIQDALLWGSPGPYKFLLRDYHSLWWRVPAHFVSLVEVPCGAQNTTFPFLFRGGIQFALCRFRSLLLAVSLFGFFSCRY